MKRIALFAALAALVAAPVWAQSTKASEPLKLPPKAEAKAGAKTDAIKPVVRRLDAKSYLDARECLKEPTNHDIIVCAEKFL
ncbi:MAG TPA: hypothetical protein VLX30_00205 [Burkholderiales bacterium]|nr:hypothetical protein [Burkholderiales bacterium]